MVEKAPLHYLSYTKTSQIKCHKQSGTVTGLVHIRMCFWKGIVDFFLKGGGYKSSTDTEEGKGSQIAYKKGLKIAYVLLTLYTFPYSV